MFYTYNQNNSGGSFVGPQYVIIEADSPKEADSIAEDRAGLYFNGYGDCSCCGNRWYEASGYDAEEYPSIYGQDVSLPRDEFIEKYKKEISQYAWYDYNVDVYYADGSKYELRIPVEELQELKDEATKAQPSRWGFLWYPDRSVPSEVTQVFLRDYGSWYDIEGNFSLDVDPQAKEKVNTTVNEYGIHNWYGENKDDLDALRAKFILSISDLRDSLLQCIDDSNADLAVKAIFAKKVGGYE